MIRRTRSLGTTGLRAQVQVAVSAFRDDERGGIALMAALSASVLLGAAGAAVDYASLSAQRQALQRAADAAAIATTRELTISSAADTGRISTVARKVANAQLGLPAADQSLQVTATPNATQSGVDVVVRRKPGPALIGLFTAPEDLSAASGARRSGAGKLCVLVLSTHKPNEDGALKLDDRASLDGRDCGVFVNSKGKEAISSTASAVLKAPLICSSGGFKLGATASMNYQGERRTDCPQMENPLAGRSLPPPPKTCRFGSEAKPAKLVIDRTQTLPAGRYCGGIEIKDGVTVTLTPSSDGNILYIDNGPLEIGKSTLQGGDQFADTGVALAFTGKSAKFDMRKESIISLYAPASGDLAGILIYGNPYGSEYDEYKIDSDAANVLVGTIYIPQGFLSISSEQRVADRSPWTVVIVSRLQMTKAPNLVLNTNYHQTKVPVPAGVARTMGPVVLSQ